MDVIFFSRFSICGIQHFQRGGNHQFTLFESFWFSVVTFSTVGYGDIYPDIWISQLFMALMIGAVIVILPTQVFISSPGKGKACVLAYMCASVNFNLFLINRKTSLNKI